MKRTAENRYPHSATLFKFCKEALAIRYEGNVKVIDQDVGAILGYDPADCSHWKKGKKNIRALGTLRSIASHLNVDERLLIDITSGNIELEEAIFEFKGYGDFILQGKSLENLRKEFFKNPTRWQPDTGSLSSFEDLFTIDRNAVSSAVEAILAAGSFTEAPVYIPEVYQIYPNIRLVAQEDIGQAVEISTDTSTTPATVTVRHKGSDMRPYIRFLLAKELFKFLVQSKNPMVAKFVAAPTELVDIHSNIFASTLLVPTKLLRTEVEKIDSSQDIVQQLADTFWASKALMNQRLRDYMEHMR